MWQTEYTVCTENVDVANNILERPLPRKACQGYKRPQAPLAKKRGEFPGFCSLPGYSLHIFPLFQTQKTHQSLLIFFLLHQKYQVLFLYQIFFFLVLPLGFGIQGCGCSFLATIHTPNFLNLFLAFILLFMLYVLCHAFYAQIYLSHVLLARSTCFYACLHVYLSFLHASCFRPCFPMLCSSFCSMLMLRLHAHMFV